MMDHIKPRSDQQDIIPMMKLLIWYVHYCEPIMTDEERAQAITNQRKMMIWPERHRSAESNYFWEAVAKGKI